MIYLYPFATVTPSHDLGIFAYRPWFIFILALTLIAVGLYLVKTGGSK